MSSSEDANSKCFSGIIRRLLCTGGLPTHPSDLIPEPINTTASKLPEKDSINQAKSQAPATPGIVARLMGLDSLPDVYCAPKQRTTLESILRSRSVNSVDYLSKFDPNQPQHRRVRTSVSFREVPTFMQQQHQRQQQQLNHDCFVLCFEKVGGGNKMSLGVSEPKMGMGEFKQREVDAQRNGENLEERRKENQEKKKRVCKRKEEPIGVYGKHSPKIDPNVNFPSKNKVVKRQQPSESENMKAKCSVKKQTNLKSKKKSWHKSRKIEPMCSSENSTPVSVIDLHETTSREESRVTVPNSRKKPSSNSTRAFRADDHALRAKRNRDEKQVKSREAQYYSQLLGEICTLAEEDIRESIWMTERVTQFEDFEEICTDFGQQILDLLFYQVIDELLACNLKSSALSFY